jgi:hypothetical protein
MGTASSSRGLGTSLRIILPLSLAAGFMVGGVGTLIYPPVGAWAGNLVCAGKVEVQSDYYNTPHGGSGVQRRIGCVSGAGDGAAREDITMMTFAIALLAYAALAFVLLQIFAARWIRRRAESRVDVRYIGGDGSNLPGSSPDLQAILAQVADSLRRGDADVTVRNITIGDPDGGDPDGNEIAERLARLEQLRGAGVISDEEYRAGRAEILSSL